MQIGLFVFSDATLDRASYFPPLVIFFFIYRLPSFRTIKNKQETVSGLADHLQQSQNVFIGRRISRVTNKLITFKEKKLTNSTELFIFKYFSGNRNL